MSNSTSDTSVETDSPHDQTQYYTGLDRFARFKIYVENAINQVAAGVSEDEYLNLFGKLKSLRKTKSAPIRMQNRMKTNLAESIKSEINEMVQEENMKEKLQELDILVDKFALEDGNTAWRPNGNVQDHLRSHAVQVKLKHIRELEKLVLEREQNTEKLRQELSSGRDQIRSIESTLLSLIKQSKDCSELDAFDMKIEEQAFSKPVL